jgi:hypothetical protein
MLAGVARTSIQPADPADPADIQAVVLVRSLDDALNAHDSEGVLQLLATEATVQDAHEPQTRPQIRGWIDELIRQNVQLALIDEPSLLEQYTPRQATLVSWRAKMDLQMYRSLGVSFVPATLSASVADGAIVSLSLRADPNWNALLNLTGLT